MDLSEKQKINRKDDKDERKEKEVKLKRKDKRK